LKTDRVGRDGYIGLVFEWRGGRTVLTSRRCRAPLQVLEPINLPGGALGVMLLNNGGGMVGGDRATIEMTLGAGARTVVTTASAGRVYRALDEPARHQTVVTMRAESTLDYAPDHLIPHAGAAIEQSLEVAMGSASRAIIVNAMASGRVGRDERFAFRTVDDVIRVTRNGGLVYESRARIVPDEIDPARPGVMDGFDYVAAMVVAGETTDSWDLIARRLQSRLERESPIGSVSGGVSALAQNGCLARILAPGAESMRRALAGLWAEARAALHGDGAALVIRK
jgi:urease accessory protein